MISNPKTPGSWVSVLLVVAAVALWAYNEIGPSSRKPANLPRSEPPAAAAGKVAARENTGSYEVHRGCTLVEARNNDGDSFLVRLPDGRRIELRLYFVDSPESAFKSYPNGENNHNRIRQQAAEMGGIAPEQAVEIGRKAKAFTLQLLGARPFTIYTEWDSPYNDNRFHAHIEVFRDGKPHWLHHALVERGLVRMKTKPADLPDGTSAAKEKETLRELERAAKRSEHGVWGL